MSSRHMLRDGASGDPTLVLIFAAAYFSFMNYTQGTKDNLQSASS